MTKPPPPNSAQMLARLLGGSDASRPSRLGVLTLAAVVFTVVVLAFVLWPLIDLRVNPPPPVAGEAPAIESSEFEDGLDGYLAQIDGRSPFHKPLPPEPKTEVAQPEGPRPTRYGGPAIVAMINNAVWFSDGQRLKASEASPSGSLKVIELRAPWSARIAWNGGEFDVDFFQRSALLTGKHVDAPDDWSSSSGLSSRRSASPASGKSPSSRPSSGANPPPAGEPPVVVPDEPPPMADPTRPPGAPPPQTDPDHPADPAPRNPNPSEPAPGNPADPSEPSDPGAAPPAPPAPSPEPSEPEKTRK